MDDLSSHAPQASSSPMVRMRYPARPLLLIQLGTPAAPQSHEVKKYLGEFLMDPLVLPMAWPLRWLLVHGKIIPKRLHSSVAAYRSIWTPQGSPLLFHTLQLRSLLQASLGSPWEVSVGMRYGNPSLEKAIHGIMARSPSEILCLPLYPQYALATYESAKQRVISILNKYYKYNKTKLLWVPPFYGAAEWVQAWKRHLRIHLPPACDHVVMSFHGVPLRHLRKTCPARQGFTLSLNLNKAGGKGCTSCEAPSREAHELHDHPCYLHHCLETARHMAAACPLDPRHMSLCFQSRMGTRERWLTPETTQVLQALPRQGYRNIAVIAPSFVSDCLETLEELGLRGRDTFLQHGGESFTLIPCLNASHDWVDALATLIKRTLAHASPCPTAP